MTESERGGAQISWWARPNRPQSQAKTFLSLESETQGVPGMEEDCCRGHGGRGKESIPLLPGAKTGPLVWGSALQPGGTRSKDWNELGGGQAGWLAGPVMSMDCGAINGLFKVLSG